MMMLITVHLIQKFCLPKRKVSICVTPGQILLTASASAPRARQVTPVNRNDLQISPTRAIARCLGPARGACAGQARTRKLGQPACFKVYLERLPIAGRIPFAFSIGELVIHPLYEDAVDSQWLGGPFCIAVRTDAKQLLPRCGQ